VRTYATASAGGFEPFSPYTQPEVIAVAEGVPYTEMTGYDHERLYALKGEIVAAGVKAVTGISMPVYPKRRFQHGAAERPAEMFPADERAYRKAFMALHG
jgi:asparagine synthase (glutamine-hydrolysing)